jgi:hypothetical protein
MARCFEHHFGHHQALNEHSQVIKHWIQYGSVFVDRLLSREYVNGIYYKITNMIKGTKNIHKITNMIKRYKNGYTIKIGIGEV